MATFWTMLFCIYRKPLITFPPNSPTDTKVIFLQKIKACNSHISKASDFLCNLQSIIWSFWKITPSPSPSEPDSPFHFHLLSLFHTQSFFSPSSLSCILLFSHEDLVQNSPLLRPLGLVTLPSVNTQYFYWHLTWLCPSTRGTPEGQGSVFILICFFWPITCQGQDRMPVSTYF